MSIHDYSTPQNPLGDSGSPYSPGTPLGDSLRWYEIPDGEPLIDPSYTPYNGKIPVKSIAITFILGIWGAIILGFLL
jgi:hypothetical protein